MANDVKSGIGYLIPASGVVGFIIALLLGEFLVSILITVLGILVWFLYMLVMESTIPKQMGNMIMLFGVMLSVGIFLGFGVTQNLWGGFEFRPEGSLLSLVILFFAILTGLNFRNQQSILRSSSSSTASLSDDDREFVLSAIDKAKNSNLKHRPVGLGVMGFQDALYKIRVPYESEEAVNFADKSMEYVSYFAIEASMELAKERGAYESFSGSLWSQGIMPVSYTHLRAHET